MAEDFGPGIPGQIKNYRLIRRLGSGGMGAVFEAEDVRDGSRVAIKLLHSHLATDSSFRERFEREAHVAALLRSPYVVHLLDYGVANGIYFLAIEFIDGQDVAVLSRNAPIDPKRALQIATYVALALEESGARGLVHRDIKPENILIGNDGSVKLSDFGIARRSGTGGDLTLAGGFIGSAAYAAPEQTTDQVDGRADIYALGCTLFAMLTGRPPFEGTVYQLIAQHQNAPVPMGPLSGLPDSVINIIRRCMEKDPADRYRDASELVSALGRASRSLTGVPGAGSAGAARQVSPAAPTPPPPAPPVAPVPSQEASPARLPPAPQRGTATGPTVLAPGVGAGASPQPVPLGGYDGGSSGTNPPIYGTGSSSGGGKGANWLLIASILGGLLVFLLVGGGVWALTQGDDNPPGSSDDDDDDDRATRTPRPTSTPTTEPATVAPTRAGTINAKIGTMFALTGTFQAAGKSAERGVELAVEEINTKNAVPGVRLTVVGADDQGLSNTTAAATTAAKKLITTDQVVAIIGPGSSLTADAVSTEAQAAGVPFVSDTFSAPDGEYIFNIDQFSDDTAFQSLEKSGDVTKATTYALLIHDNIPFCDAGFRDGIKELGGTVVIEQKIGAIADIPGAVAAIKAANPQAIAFASGYTGESGNWVKGLRNAGFTQPIIICGDSRPAQVLVDFPMADNVFVAVAWAPVATNKKSQDFVAAFRAKYGQAPDLEAAHAYVRVYLVAEAINRAGAADRAKVRDELAGLDRFDTILGPVTFNDSRNLIYDGDTFHIKGGRLTELE